MSADWIAHAEPWFLPALSMALAVALATIGARVGIAVLRRLALRKPFAGPFVAAAAGPATLIAAVVAASSVLQAAPNALPGIAPLRHLATLILIATATWLGMRLSGAIADSVALRYPADIVDNLQARRIQTQTRVLTRTLASVVGVVGVSFALLTFPEVRTIGAGLLASAGVAGLAVGLAAKPILGNLLAGLQIAFTQPIRLDDIVIVEGEWGRIEEIGHSFVVVAIWDQRRLIVPLQQFIEKPFQNWTRTGSQLLGTVVLWVDYGAPVDALRAEARRVCEASPDWDKRVCLIQVTDASERAMQLRVLVSSADAGRNWDLRCALREALIAFLREHYPEYLPRVRTELSGQASPSAL